MLLAGAGLVHVVGFAGSVWWLVAADLLLLAACRHALAAVVAHWGPVIAATDVFGLALLAVLILCLPLVAPVALVLAIRDAVRADPRG